MNFVELHAEIAFKKIQFLLVSVNGVPGCGKTTRLGLIEMVISSHPDWQLGVVPEPVDEWVKSGILELYYSDIPRWGLVFQQEVMRTRTMGILHTIQETVRKSANDGQPKTIILLSERTPDSDCMFMDMLHDSNMISEVEYQLYQSWCELWISMIPKTRLCHIFIDTPVSISMQRIQDRNRPGEKIDVDYQTRLYEKHKQFYRNMDPFHLFLQLDGAIDVKSDKDSVTRQCQEIIQFIQKQLE